MENDIFALLVMLHEMFVQFAFSLNDILMWSTVVTCSLYIIAPIINSSHLYTAVCQPQYDMI